MDSSSTHSLNGQIRRSNILCRGQHILAQQRAHQRIQTQSLHTLDFMQVRVRGLGSLTRRARNRPHTVLFILIKYTPSQSKHREPEF